MMLLYNEYGEEKMKYEAAVKHVLNEFGIGRNYAGYDYIIDGIHFMEMDESSIRHITKTLYIDIAKKHNTTSICVERNIRTTIEIMWRNGTKDAELMIRIFGSGCMDQRPSNTRFFELLYEYVVGHGTDKCSVDCPCFKCRYCMRVVRLDRTR